MERARHAVVRPALLGAVDGIITSFAIVISSYVGDFSTAAVMIAGFSSLLADGLSMGVSEYLSSRTAQARAGERRRALALDLRTPDRRLEVLDALRAELKRHGSKPHDARRLAAELSLHPVAAARVLGVAVDDEGGARAWLLGAVCFASFVACGSVPIVAYLPAKDPIPSVVCSLVLLVGLGASRRAWRRWAALAETVGLGVAAGLVAWGCARVVRDATE